MELNKMKRNLTKYFQKYKFVILIVLAGIVLMLIPSNVSKKEEVIQPETEHVSLDEENLESILSKVKGVGKVEVMLKEATGSEVIYETNYQHSTSDSASDINKQVITVTDSDRNENGLVKQVNPPQYAGAIIICQGAKDPAVKLAVTDAVSKITGLGADKIAVLIMK